MLVHSEKLNPCKCGSKKKPDLDSDDMVPCWAVQCWDCRQFVHDSNWTMSGAVKAWNNANPVLPTGGMLKTESVCPECGEPLIEKWSGVKCSKCEYWECY